MFTNEMCVLIDGGASAVLTEKRGRAWRVHCSRRSTVSGSAGLRACSRKACSTTSSTSCCRPFTVCSTRRPDTTRINSTNSSPVTSSRTCTGETGNPSSTCAALYQYHKFTMFSYLIKESTDKKPISESPHKQMIKKLINEHIPPRFKSVIWCD